jgi:hypothetical protein
MILHGLRKIKFYTKLFEDPDSSACKFAQISCSTLASLQIGLRLILCPPTLCKVENQNFVTCHCRLCYSSRHQTACFKVTEGLHPPYRAALSQHYSVASFATLLILSCLHSHSLRYSCRNVVRFCCDLETYNFMTATVVYLSTLLQVHELCSEWENDYEYTIENIVKGSCRCRFLRCYHILCRCTEETHEMLQ